MWVKLNIIQCSERKRNGFFSILYICIKKKKGKSWKTMDTVYVEENEVIDDFFSRVIHLLGVCKDWNL